MATRPDSPPPTVELLVQLNGLVQRRLLQRVSRAMQLDGARMRCVAPEKVVFAAAEAVKFDLKSYFDF